MMTDSVVFDRAASYYDETRGFPEGVDAQAAELVRETGGLTPDSVVLEVGVGTGRVALPVSAHVGHMVGVDLSLPMMRRLRAKQTTERVAIAQADALALPFAAATFDAVLAVHIFHLIPQYNRALGEAARVLKPGAPLINTWTENFHRREWWELWEQALGRGAHRGATTQTPVYLVENGWMPDGDVYTLSFHTHKSPAQFLDQLRARVWSSAWELSDAELDLLVERVRSAMRDAYDDLDTPLATETHFRAQRYVPPPPA